MMNASYPPPIYSTEPGSWAHQTVAVRFPEIARRMLSENNFSTEVEDQLIQLIEEINQGEIRYLKDQGAPDQAAWRRYVKPYAGMNWLEVPWFFAEHYFYRRIMEGVQYFKTREDPFRFQKRQGLLNSISEVENLAEFLARSQQEPVRPDQSLSESLYFALGGNQADLSLWPAGSEDDPKHDSQQILQDHLLANDIRQVVNVLNKGSSSRGRVDILLDNAGFELVADLGLVDILLGLDFADRVVLHVKAHPTFVSDVIDPDIDQTIQYLSESRHPALGEFAERLRAYLDSGRVQIREDYFWNAPLPLWKYPAGLGEEWSLSALLISKGDANYRKILGDRQWDFTLPFPVVVDYLPVALAALRTLKAELAVGLDLGQIQEIFNRDNNWLTDGKWGVIHYAPRGKN